MKKLAYIWILTVLLAAPLYLSADLPGQAPTSINKPNPNPFPKAAPTKEPRGPSPRAQKPQPTAKDVGTPFTLPGIIGIRASGWVGSDNLYNVAPHISIYIEVATPEGQKLLVNEAQLKARVAGIFTKGGIQPIALHAPGDPSLPLFHVLIMSNQVEQCMTASVAARLFEAVTLKRAAFDPGITFQAITWEKQDLITAAQSDFYSLLEKTIDEFALDFVDRFKYFQNLKVQRQEGL